MNIILTQDVPHLGSLGDEVTVKSGYARNFLLPKGMAIVSGSRNASEVEHRKSHLEVMRKTAIELAQKESAKVASLEVVIKAKSGPNGKLFGSVTNKDVQAALEALGYTLDRRAIVFHSLVKNVGSHTATVRLHTDVKTDIQIKVVGEISDEAKKAAPEEEESIDAENILAEGAAAEGGASEEVATDVAAEPAEPAPAEGETPSDEAKSEATDDAEPQA